MMNANALKRYCEMCDRWWGSRAYDCPACGDKTVPRARFVKASKAHAPSVAAKELGAAAEATRRCDAWHKAGETLRAAVAWRLFEGKGDILSAMTGVPYPALSKFVETGELDHVHRMILEASARVIGTEDQSAQGHACWFRSEAQ